MHERTKLPRLHSQKYQYTCLYVHTLWPYCCEHKFSLTTLVRWLKVPSLPAEKGTSHEK